ncbi:hypothetical protein [Comamonas serinivorans]|nr:hypothetical protein [Comamonas serinivorans]
MKKLVALAGVVVLAGCANTTGTDGIVKVDKTTYMLGGLGGMLDFSSSGAKTRMIRQAQEFCAEQDKEMTLVSSTGKDSGLGTYASAEILFRCDAK